jgi:hypothetical protein
MTLAAYLEKTRANFERAADRLDDEALADFIRTDHCPALLALPPCLTLDDAAAALAEIQRWRTNDDPMLTDAGEDALLECLRTFHNRTSLTAVA